MTDSEGDDRPQDGPPETSKDDPFEYPSDERASSTDERDPPPVADSSRVDKRPAGVVGWLKWFWTTDTGWALYARDIITSVSAVLIVGLLLFAISGIWPPMVAIESGSMEPNMHEGDLVFVVDNERFTPDESPASTGVVPADMAHETGHAKFGSHGDVIVFLPDGSDRRTPVIHRAMLWVDEGEDWADRADPAVSGGASDCAGLDNCPAPHAGFITLGDANPSYDQVNGLSEPVRPEWIVGTAEVRVPYLGNIRLFFSDLSTTGPQPVHAGTVDSPNATGAVGPTNATATTAGPSTPTGPVRPVA